MRIFESERFSGKGKTLCIYTSDKRNIAEQEFSRHERAHNMAYALDA